jgi:hypothetical protein
MPITAYPTHTELMSSVWELPDYGTVKITFSSKMKRERFANTVLKDTSQSQPKDDISPCSLN